MPTIPQRRFLRGLNAATPRLAQAQGYVPRISNMFFTRRGSLRTVDGSKPVLIYTGPGAGGDTGMWLHQALYTYKPTPVVLAAIKQDKLTSIPVPAVPALASAVVGTGILNPGTTYAYRITAMDAYGNETAPTAETAIVLAAANNAVQLTITQQLSAFAYRIYGRTAGNERFIDTIIPPVIGAASFTYIDDGTQVVSGVLPVGAATFTTGITELTFNPNQETDSGSYGALSFHLPGSPYFALPGSFAAYNFDPTNPAIPIYVTLLSQQLTPNGGISNQVGPLPQTVCFDNEVIYVLGNGYPLQTIVETRTGGGDNVSINFSLLAIANTFVPVYPAPATTTSFATGALIQVTVGGVPTVFKAVQGGVSGGAAPVWPAALGATVADGTVLWANQGPVGTSLAPRGAAHAVAYAGSLWIANTAPQTTADKQDGPSCIKMSDINNPNSWNPLNVAFISRDDGEEIMGMSPFTIGDSGITPTGSLVVFKNTTTHQIIGVFGSSNFAIQQAQTDLGCIAPRSIQFLPGFGIMRLTHMGFGLFDGVRDRLVGEEIRPYLFGGEDDITPLDWGFAYACKGAQVAAPPIYVCTIPKIGDHGLATRLVAYDLVLKAWSIIDLPFAVTSISQMRSGETLPVTVIGHASDGSISRIFAGDATWDGAAISWSVRTPEVLSKSDASRIYPRRIYVRGLGTPAGITAQATFDGSADIIQAAKLIQQGSMFEAFADLNSNCNNVHADVSGTGTVDIESFNWDVEVMPATPAAMI